MYPVLFEIPLPGDRSLPVHAYGFMILAGFFLCVAVVSKEGRRRGREPFAYDLGLVMLLCGLLGGRLTYFLQFHERFEGESWLEFFALWRGGLVFYGGAIGGLLGALPFMKWRRVPMVETFDLASFGAPIAMGFGRLGCFLYGCCHGVRCDPSFALGVVFPVGSPAHSRHLRAGILSSEADAAAPVHPVQFYELTTDFLLAGLLYLYVRNDLGPRGAGLPLVFVLYGGSRFLLEFLRGDHVLTATGLTLSQNLSLGLVLVFGSVLIFIYARAARAARAGIPSDGES